MEPAPTHDKPPFRIGHGYDLHRLEPQHPLGPGKPLLLAGILIPHDKGPVAHSDGDVLLHAVTDALLGALAAPDIGQLFPDTDPANKGRPSADFLREAVSRVSAAGYHISNIDATIVCERPKLAAFKGQLIESLRGQLGSKVGSVNIKAKTHEGVDAVGQGHAIEVHVVALLSRPDST